jgi:hypothetical protein
MSRATDFETGVRVEVIDRADENFGEQGTIPTDAFTLIAKDLVMVDLDDSVGRFFRTDQLEVI